MSESWQPELLDDERLWGRYESSVNQLEFWRRRAERDLAELVLRGLITEFAVED